MMMMIAQSNNIITEEKRGGLWPLSPPQNDAYGGAYLCTSCIMMQMQLHLSLWALLLGSKLLDTAYSVFM